MCKYCSYVVNIAYILFRLKFNIKIFLKCKYCSYVINISYIPFRET